MRRAIPPHSEALSMGELYISNSAVRLTPLDYTPRKSRRSAPQFYALTCARQLLTSIGRGRLLRMFDRVRTSDFPDDERLQLATLTRWRPKESAVISPFTLDSWRSLIIRFNLDKSLQSSDRLGAMRCMSGGIIVSPSDLIGFPAALSACLRVMSPLVRAAPGTTAGGSYRFGQWARVCVGGPNSVNLAFLIQPRLRAQSHRTSGIADSTIERGARNRKDRYRPTYRPRESMGRGEDPRLARAGIRPGEMILFVDPGVNLDTIRRALGPPISTAFGIS